MANQIEIKKRENKTETLATREERIRIALNHMEPDRVPFVPSLNNFYAYHYGVKIKEAMTNPASLKDAIERYLNDYDPDWVYKPGLFPIKPMETIGHNQARWPGSYWNLPDDTPYQYVDKEYLTSDDWDEFFRDPTLFIFTKVLPQKYKALEGFANFNPYSICGQSIINFTQCGLPGIADGLEAMRKTGQEVLEFSQGNAQLSELVTEAGYPIFGDFVGCCPFDDFADNIRGIMPACMDMITDPEFIDEAVNRWGDVTIPATVKNAKRIGARNIFIPLHVGMDNFMSVSNYEKHYWPSLKRLINEMIKADITPIVFCEGKYDTRLEIISDIPENKVIYTFENVNLVNAKKILGNVASIGAGMKTDTLMRGTPEQVEDEVKMSIDLLAGGGGFFMMNTSALDQVPAENMHAWRNAVEKYGYYR